MQKRKQSASCSDDSYDEYLRNKNKKKEQTRRRRSRSRSLQLFILLNQRSPNRNPNRNTHHHHRKHHQHERYQDQKQYEYGKPNQQAEPTEIDKDNNQPDIDKENPSFSPSGILAEFSNKINGTVLKFTEPVDTALPDGTWRLYPFKSDEALEVINLSGQNSFLIGKDPTVSDILMQNPTVSGQHAVIQFRKKQKIDFRTQEFEEIVLPYVMDLLSTNGTIMNGEKIEPQRYIELRNKDILKFGFSSRDYVLMQVFSDPNASGSNNHLF